MSFQFLKERPIQAGKFPVIVVTLLFAMSSIYGFLPNQGSTGFFRLW